MRDKILEKLITTLEPLDFALALWQGGSAASGYTDEWSDIDIHVIRPLARIFGRGGSSKTICMKTEIFYRTALTYIWSDFAECKRFIVQDNYFASKKLLRIK